MKKKIIVLISALILIIVILFSIKFVVNKSNSLSNVTTIRNSTIAENDYSLKTVIVEADNSLQNMFGAAQVEKKLEKYYILHYETEEQTKNAYEQLKNDKNITSVELDERVDFQTIDSKAYNVDLVLTQNSNYRGIVYGTNDGIKYRAWGTICMGLDKSAALIEQNGNISNIVVAAIDTGLDLNNMIISELIERIDSRYYDAYYKTPTIEERQTYGHGTHITSIILDSTAKNVKVLPIATCVPEKNDTTYTIVAEALEYAINANVDVISMSISFREAIQKAPTIIKEFLKKAIDNNITVVVAAGNSTDDVINYYPANEENVICVSALTSNRLKCEGTGENIAPTTESLIDAQNTTTAELGIPYFSNYGKLVDYSAPGDHIIGTGNSATGNTTTVMSGTSQATPYVSAAVATIKSYNNTLTNKEVENALDYYAIDLGTTGRDDHYGKGYVCFKNARECTCGDSNCYRIYCKGCTNTNCIYPNNTVTLNGISIASLPNKLNYKEDDDLDTTGLTLTAVYSDSSTQTISNGFSCSPIKLSTVGTQTITVTYENLTTTFTVTVEALSVEILKNNSKYIIEDNYLKNVEINTDITEILSNITDGLTVEIKQRDNLITSGIVKTGMEISINKNDRLIGKYIIVVTGDTNGSGTVALIDVINTIKQYNNKKVLTNEYLMAVDTNNDKIITLLELISEIKLYKKQR